MVAGYHRGYDETGHGEQSAYVGVYHLVPVVHIALVFRLQSACQSGIVDQHIHFGPLLGQTGNGIMGGLPVPYIEHQWKHLHTLSLQFPLQTGQEVGAPCCDYQIVAGLCKLVCATLADAACGTCYQRDGSSVHVQYVVYGCVMACV